MTQHRRSARRTAKQVAIAAIGAALSLFAMSPFAAGVTPPMSPAAGSDDVLARLDAEPELRLQYRVERAGTPAETVTIGLARDYHYRSSPLGLTVYDYRVRRIFRLSSGSQFVNDSLYAEVWYRRAELENRAMIAAALNKGGIDAGRTLPAQDPFWAETELGLTTTKFARPSLQRTELQGRIAWRTNDDEVLAVRYRRDAVPEELRASLRRLWPSIAAIHPQIADELAQSGRLPEELWVKQIDHTAKSFENAHWTLIHGEWTKQTKYPLPPHVQAVASEPGGARQSPLRRTPLMQTSGRSSIACPTPMCCDCSGRHVPPAKASSGKMRNSICCMRSRRAPSLISAKTPAIFMPGAGSRSQPGRRGISVA
jgi:hypothetical protein